MITANQLKSGKIFDVNGAPHIAESVSKQTPSARGAATLYKVKARNLLTRSKTNLTCRGDDSFAEPDFQNCEAQFLYENAGTCVFMDLESYEQYELPSAELAEQLPFLTEDLEGVRLLILAGRVVGVNVPDVVVMELIECDPAVKGASATARTKPAMTATGLTVQVPEYMARGESVRVDTATGRFMSRA